MELTIRGKNVKVSDERRELIETKLGKLNHYLEAVHDATVELTAQHSHKLAERLGVELTLRVNGTILRAEEQDSDLATALDKVHDKMQRQMVRYKERQVARRGRTKLSDVATPLEPAEEPSASVEFISPVKVKTFPIIPMVAEEAIEELEYVGHDFYMYMDSESKQINVVYRRKEGGYGLLKPEV
ncbi:MAG: ribosome-associated translation inhibitor RaiA [Chloroflexi bacterium]|uniref:Ribosome hibernation promoting factor n=1 Tax=Candidatus Chlorohelix allophototropha TaxID=3003348 RepID=A0A8T7M0F1_9CHLR|nr:ribosome-associated translation inhibitor RaiA [Chloroflexota bacterium]WJW65569.1 ribosome-associated translation inhibitor RaiA [Chloroflexota bacterium L227-S17]